MHANAFTGLYAYNEWANHRVWACIEALNEARFDQHLDYSIGSIHNQINHLMSVETWWFIFLQTGQLRFVSEEDVRTRATIRARWDETESLIRTYTASLTDEELLREVRPDFWNDDQPPVRVYEALFQVLNHSTDHRAQILAGLNRLGAPTTPQDYLFFHFDRAGAKWENA
jgi:uncharacterized damage-inducible protein DinB